LLVEAGLLTARELSAARRRLGDLALVANVPLMITAR
jgi:hypothetical protein